MSDRMENMKIAVTYDNGKVFGHFGHTEYFKVYEVENGRVKSSSVLSTQGSGHCALADFLKQSGVAALICGGIGAGAKRALAEAKISLYGGVVGDTDQAVADLLENKLAFDSDAECDEHDHHHEHHHGGHGCHGSCESHAH